MDSTRGEAAQDREAGQDRGPGGRPGKADIRGRADLDVLLRRFYGAAFADPRIGPFFTEIAGTDLEVHLPRIADFWERALFRGADYRRDAFAPHAALDAARTLTAGDFGRWVQLWRATIDGLYRGPNAERAKAQGERMAVSLHKRLAGADGTGDGDGTGFVPLAVLELRPTA
ncbi:group III truncated hemoglobin [Streptomyces sp. G-G2]|uniref:group III truncated hemoglobin n=1 Tax=Streptomyces sp. G-G2 TaxID=3046201 RepID=UPI0024BB434C|nr:group III truncated hemoglobin [Streptomyces sp. G-G2]MDJ0383858.1 group III truncated hemoglobin [Streptomyces sp. G-G2]